VSGPPDDDEPASAPSAAFAETAATPERGATQGSARTFQPGEFVARRYQVIRFIARGGMGEVYEVDDVELQARVALKTLRRELGDDEELLSRFRREINLSRKVTHAKVCRIFDLGFHTSPRGRVAFLTMELLDGESLHRRIKRSGRFTPEEALPIVEQMARGLGAPHAPGSASALQSYRRALPMYERAANPAGVEAMHTNIGQQLQRARQLDEAERELKLAFELARQIGERRGEAVVLESLGGLYLDRGELSRALDTFSQATALATQNHDATTVAQTRRKQGEALHPMGRVREAEEAFLDGIAKLDGMDETARSADGKLRLARLYVDLDRVADAEKLARDAVEQHRRAGVDSGEAGAVLARVLVAGRKLAEARAVADAALARSPEDLHAYAAVADVELAEGHAEAAVARLRCELSARLAEVPARLDAELLLARALEAAGHSAEAAARRSATAAEATKKGFALIAKQAARPSAR